MIRSLFNDTTSLILHTALDGLARRQQVTANNIANAETPGFKASAVTFESRLDALLPGAVPELILARTDPQHLGAGGETMTPQVVELRDTVGRNDQNNVDIDREMVTLAETTLTFNAITRLSAKRLGLLKAAITEGRG